MVHVSISANKKEPLFTVFCEECGNHHVFTMDQAIAFFNKIKLKSKKRRVFTTTEKF
jgi:hypothetical protein